MSDDPPDPLWVIVEILERIEDRMQRIESRIKQPNPAEATVDREPKWIGWDVDAITGLDCRAKNVIAVNKLSVELVLAGGKRYLRRFRNCGTTTASRIMAAAILSRERKYGAT